MKFVLWIILTVCLLLASVTLSSVAIPIGDSLCPTPVNGGEAFAGGLLMLVAGTCTLLIGSIVALVTLQDAWEETLSNWRVLSKLIVGNIIFPLFWLLVSVAYSYMTCHEIRENNYGQVDAHKTPASMRFSDNWGVNAKVIVGSLAEICRSATVGRPAAMRRKCEFVRQGS